MGEFRSAKPLIIYRIPDRTGLFRSFGLFCLGHTIIWGGMAFAWYTGKSSTNIEQISLDNLKKLLRKNDRSNEPSLENKPKFIQSIEAKLPKLLGPLEKQFEQIRQSNAESAAKFSDSLRPFVATLSDLIEQNRTNLISGFAVLIACTTLWSGYFLPRRVVRQLSLLPLGSPASFQHGHTTSKIQQLVEISTYDAFGLRSQGVKITVPMSFITTKADQKKHFLSFRVKNQSFPFILQTEDAEFPEPEEFECVFVLGSRK